MQHVAFVFIMPVVSLYMFRVLFAPIIRSVQKLYMQILVQSSFRYGVRAGRIGDEPESGTNRTMP